MLWIRRSFALLVLVAGTLLTVASPGIAADGPEEMPWSTLSRFGGDADGDGRLDGKSLPGDPKVLDLGRVPVVVRPSEAICEAASPAWRLDGRSLAAPKPVGKDECAVLVPVPEGEHTIAVSAGGSRGVARVDVDDLLIVALGDSVGSGEGNSLGLGRKGWLEPRCHRSAAAGFEQAAKLLAQGVAEEPPGHSITFVSLACSGAKIGIGLLEPYDGIDPLEGERDLDPQVERLRRIAAERPRANGKPSVDAVLVSVGGNDVGFSRVVGTCAASIRDCSPQLEAQVAADLAQLPLSYELLNRALDGAAPDAPVLIAEYFDPTRDERGRFCRHSIGLTSRSEAQWAYEAVLRPLNAEIESAAARGGWQYVGGIAADFEQHGYCVDGSERWVRVLSGSGARQGDPWGTMHPSFPGHTAIARRVVGPLATSLGLTPPEVPPIEEESRTVLEWVAVGLTVAIGPIVALQHVWLLGLGPLATWPWLIVAFLIGSLLIGPILLVLWALARLVLLWRPTWPEDPYPEGGSGTDKHPPIPPISTLDLRKLLIIGGGMVAAILLATFLTGLAGRLILWLRFWSSNLPADQAADAVPASELVVVGSHALGFFFVLGLAAVGIAWLLDGRGRWVREARRGVAAIGLAEVLIAVSLGDFPADQALEMVVALTLSALLLYYLVDVWLSFRKKVDAERDAEEEAGRTKKSRLRVILTRIQRWVEAKLADRSAGSARRLVWHAVPFALLAVAVVASTGVDGFERRLWLLLPILLAALLFIGPYGMAAPGVTFRRPDTGSLLAPRIALALSTLLCIVVVIARDEAWLAASAAIAAVLAVLCMAVAANGNGRFAPYALALLVSVPLFGATATILRGIDSPELQPAAALLKNGKAVCGAYVGESDGRLWMARVRLDERADVRRPQRGAIFSIPSERIAATAVAALEPVAGLQARAVALRDAMLDERGEDDPRQRPVTCAPMGDTTPVESPSTEDRHAAAEAELLHRLAQRYQPELVIDRRDGFWPIPVRTLFSMRDRRAAICRQPAVEASPCIRLGTPGEFPWTGGRGEHLEYPAPEDDREAQYDLMVDALGTADPARSSLVYYLASQGEEGENRPITIQYWFFYAFNYQPTKAVPDGGYHEGDFESVSVLLSAKTKRPRYIWMARHDKEGRLFPWEDEELLKTDEHPQIYVARGSHASYESCSRQSRSAAPLGLIDDFPSCDAGRPLRLVPETTPLADLARVGWACWGGLFGHASGGFYKQAHLINDAPRSPLWQQRYSDIASEPCRGLADPGGRDGHTEAVVEEEQGVPTALRRRAGSMVPLVDRCADWETPAVTGTYIVACDQRALDAYLGSGLERVEQAGVRIDMARAAAPQVGEYALPAVRHNPASSYLDGWRIVAANPAEVAVFASCPRSGTDEAIAARFEGVKVTPGRPLRLLDRGGGGKWRLVEPDGSTVSDAIPFRTEEEDGALVPIDPKPGRVLACGPS